MNLHTGKDFKLVIIASGWVLAGEVVPSDDPKFLILEQSSCPQRWGTTAGIGELALCGPTADSTIHPTGRATIPLNSVLFTLDVVPEAAAKWPC